VRRDLTDEYAPAPVACTVRVSQGELSGLKSPTQMSHASMTPSWSVSAAPAARSQLSSMPFVLQSLPASSQASGTPLVLQSAAPAFTSHRADVPLVLQSIGPSGTPAAVQAGSDDSAPEVWPRVPPRCLAVKSV